MVQHYIGVSSANVLRCRRSLVAEGPTSSIRPPRSLGSTQPKGTFIGSPVALPVVLPSDSRLLIPSTVSTARSSHRTSSLLSPNIRGGGPEVGVGRNGDTRGDGRAIAKVIACAVHKSINPSRNTRNSPLIERKWTIVANSEHGNRGWIIGDCEGHPTDVSARGLVRPRLPSCALCRWRRRGGPDGSR